MRKIKCRRCGWSFVILENLAVNRERCPKCGQVPPDSDGPLNESPPEAAKSPREPAESLQETAELASRGPAASPTTPSPARATISQRAVKLANRPAIAFCIWGLGLCSILSVLWLPIYVGKGETEVRSFMNGYERTEYFYYYGLFRPFYMPYAFGGPGLGGGHSLSGAKNGEGSDFGTGLPVEPPEAIWQHLSRLRLNPLGAAFCLLMTVVVCRFFYRYGYGVGRRRRPGRDYCQAT